MTITILDLAKARGAQPEPEGTYSAASLAAVGFELLGGCASCGATIAAYNAHPSRTGFWRCGECIDGRLGFASVAEFDAWDRKEKAR